MHPIATPNSGLSSAEQAAMALVLALIEQRPSEAAQAPPGTTKIAVDLAAKHQVSALMHAGLHKSHANAHFSPEDLQRLTAAANSAAIFETSHAKECATVFKQLDEARIPFVVFKGTHLAYTLYPSPYLRERCDTDILFRSKNDALKAIQLFKTRGYEVPETMDADLYSYEKDLLKRDALGIGHAFDFHWKVRSDNLFADFISFDDLYHSGTSNIAGQKVHVPSLSQALLIAATHRLSHAAEGLANQLYWLKAFSCCSASYPGKIGTKHFGSRRRMGSVMRFSTL